MVGWIRSDPASAANARRATGHLLTTNQPFRSKVGGSLTINSSVKRWVESRSVWRHWVDLIDKSPVHHSLNQLRMMMPGPRTPRQLTADRESLYPQIVNSNRVGSKNLSVAYLASSRVVSLSHCPLPSTHMHMYVCMYVFTIKSNPHTAWQYRIQVHIPSKVTHTHTHTHTHIHLTTFSSVRRSL